MSNDSLPVTDNIDQYTYEVLAWVKARPNRRHYVGVSNAETRKFMLDEFSKLDTSEKHDILLFQRNKKVVGWRDTGPSANLSVCYDVDNAEEYIQLAHCVAGKNSETWMRGKHKIDKYQMQQFSHLYSCVSETNHKVG